MLILRLIINLGELECIMRNYKPGAEFGLIAC